jgi:3-hydroxyisobutyrate dehydrogenase-like beta-hydroxyacid dehydrogenase
MGFCSARNLIRSGHELSVYNQTKSRAGEFQGLEGGTVAANAAGFAVSMLMAILVHDGFVSALAQGLGGADWAANGRIAYRGAGI